MQNCYTNEVGRKFNADGSTLPFAGTTVISFLAPSEPIYRMAVQLQAEMRQQPFGHKFSHLPPSSFHMTVIQLLNDQGRAPERWTPHLPLTVPLTAMDEFMIEWVPTVVPPTDLQMRFVGIKRTGNMAIQLKPANATVAQTLRRYRDAIVEVTGVRLPDHETYHYHISTGYRLIQLSAVEESTLETLLDGIEQRFRAVASMVSLPAPQLTFFDDMFRFVAVAERHLLSSR